MVDLKDNKPKAKKAGHRPSAEEITASLNQEYFGAKKSTSTPNLDPVQPTPLVVRLDEMDTYSDNPRIGKNPVFDALYDRIIAQNGLQDVLSITRRPSAEKYILSAGGNTRLSALRKAYGDTENEAFATLKVLFTPYESESTIYIGHGAENYQRSNMSFIENANWVVNVKRLLEKERNTTLSQSELARIIKENGCSVDRKSIRLYEYTVKRLSNYVPKALSSGIGHPRIQEIKNAESHLWEYVEFKGLPQSKFDLVFQQVLTEHDSDQGFNVEKVKDDLYVALCDALNIDMYAFEVECDAFHLDGPDSPIFNQSDSSEDQAQKNTDFGNQKVLPDDDPPSLSRLLVDRKQQKEKVKSSKTGFDHIEQCRRTCMRIAVRIAEDADLKPCITLDYKKGYGFWIDFPRAPLDQVTGCVWWVLFSASGIFSEKDPGRVHTLPDHLSMKPLLVNQPADTADQFNSRVGSNTMSAFTLDFLFDFDIDERRIKDILNLTTACRTLLNTAKENGLDQELWTYK